MLGLPDYLHLLAGIVEGVGDGYVGKVALAGGGQAAEECGAEGQAVGIMPDEYLCGGGWSHGVG